MKRQPDERTPYQAILFDGETYFATLRFHGARELATVLSLYSRRQLDGVLRTGPRPGINPRFVLEAIEQEIRSRVADVGAQLKAQRRLHGAGRAPQRNLAHWIKVARLA